MHAQTDWWIYLDVALFMGDGWLARLMVPDHLGTASGWVLLLFVPWRILVLQIVTTVTEEYYTLVLFSVPLYFNIQRFEVKQGKKDEHVQ